MGKNSPGADLGAALAAGVMIGWLIKRRSLRITDLESRQCPPPPACARDRTHRGGAGQVVSSVAGFGENMLNLAELQARMAAVELRQNVDMLKIAGAIVVTAVMIALASFPILLAGAAEVLVSEFHWRRGFALSLWVLPPSASRHSPRWPARSGSGGSDSGSRCPPKNSPATSTGCTRCCA